MNKITWITGAGTGIGKSVTEKLFKDSLIAVSGRRQNMLDEIASQKESVKTYKLDVSDNNMVQEIYNKISENGFVDCLVNNAGIGGFNSVEKHSAEEMENIISVNLLGAIYTIKAVLPEMIKRKEGTIINILSVVNEKVFKNCGAYTASKLGLQGFLDVLREEVREHNVKVINILPGATSTSIWNDQMREKYSDVMLDSDDVAEVIYELKNLKGKAVPEKIVLRSIFGDL